MIAGEPTMRGLLLSFVVASICTVTAANAEDWLLRGRVVDENGRPVSGAAVDQYWRSNGKQVRADGSPLELNNAEELKLFHGSLGQMEPLQGAATAADGSFMLPVISRRHKVVAMDAGRKRGALVTIPEGEESKAVEITLQPLTKVHGSFRIRDTGKKPYWTNVYVEIPEDPTRPLDNFRVTQCSSFEARFETWLPPGKYILDAYGNTVEGDDIDIAVQPKPQIDISRDSREIDLGVLEMTPRTKDPRLKMVEQAKADGSWGDYTKHIGREPPPWHVVDARGVKKSVQPADFRGKWVLVEFWGLDCAVCLGRDLPNLMKIYREHADKRDKFEIVAFCIDADHDLASLADLDRRLEPIVKHAWKGQQLPFPVLLDPTFTTSRRYGMGLYGYKLLIDPSGNLVEGDENTLLEKLAQ
jgi:hypothetical protein